MKCIIIDDEKIARVALERLCNKIPDLEVIGVFSSAIDATSKLVTLSDSDVVFLDIHMPDINGFDYLDSLNIKTNVIFTTSDRDKAVEAFEIEAADYLIKPITFPRLLRAIERLKVMSSKQKEIIPSSNTHTFSKEFFVHTDKRLVRVSIDNIALVEVKGDYILIKMDNSKVHVARATLKSIEQKLNPEYFIRVHRSYIINMTKIVDIEDSSILINNQVVPISRNMKTDLMNKLNLL